MTSLLLETGARVLFHPLLLFSLFLLLSDAPGGGIVGGLIALCGFVLRWTAGGVEGVRGLLPVAPGALLAAGMLLALVTGVAGFAVGGAFLGSGSLELDLPLLGQLNATSALVFDVGVFLVVLGFGLTILDLLGREAER